MNSNYPDGCTAKDIDRHFGDDPEIDDDIEQPDPDWLQAKMDGFGDDVERWRFFKMYGEV